MPLSTIGARRSRVLLTAILVAALSIFVLTAPDASAKKSKVKHRVVTKITSPDRGPTITPTNRPETRLKGKVNKGPVRKVRAVRLKVRNLSTRQWLQDDGSFSKKRNTIRAQGKRNWKIDAVLPAGRYQVRARAVGKKLKARPSTVRFNVAARDPLTWPYPSDSFWNAPRGNRAALVPFDMDAPERLTLHPEDDLLFFDPKLPRNQWQSIAPHDGAWKNVNGAHQRCETVDHDAKLSLGGDNSFPMRELSAGEEYGITPNHSTAIVMPDYTLRETQPLAECDGGLAASQYAAPMWQGDSLITGGMGPNAANTIGGGSHGGAFMTAFGGTIRLGEWVRGGNIPHATKIQVWSQMWLTKDTSKFDGRRWPALAADSGWNGRTGYGTQAPSTRSPHAVMGALLTLPNSFNLNALRSEPARILARSIKNYGTYLVDGTGHDTVQFATEWSPEGRVYDEFQQQFGFTPDGDRRAASGAKGAFLSDMERIYESLHIVADNSRSNVGGAGAPMTFPAPPLS